MVSRAVQSMLMGTRDMMEYCAEVANMVPALSKANSGSYISLHFVGLNSGGTTVSISERVGGREDYIGSFGVLFTVGHVENRMDCDRILQF